MKWCFLFLVLEVFTLLATIESYGEDIANTETEESTPRGEEDKYEDSFIDDGEMEVLPHLPVSSSKVDEELLDKKKPKERKGIRKRLKKKYQSLASDDETSSTKQNVVNSSGVQSDSEDEDNFLLSVFKTKRASKNKIPEAGEKDGTVVVCNKKTEDNVTNDVLEGNFDALVVQREPESEQRPKNGFKSGRKRKKKGSVEVRTLETKSSNDGNGLKEDEIQQDNMDLDLLVRNKHGQSPNH